MQVEEEEVGKICYLTIQESDVQEGSTQRRGGLHIEAPPVGSSGVGGNFMAHWGGGTYDEIKDRPRGGLYMASNIAESTAVYDALICLHPHEEEENISSKGMCDMDGSCEAKIATVGEHGDIEHLRQYIPDNREYHLNPNTIYWMTDRTPHEALPVEAGVHRQYFRLVTSDISHWYAAHSTKNPNCPLPDSVTVITRSKFNRRSARIKSLNASK